MEHGESKGRSSATEHASAARTVAFLRSELVEVPGLSPAAELYEAFIEALEKVYWLQSSG